MLLWHKQNIGGMCKQDFLQKDGSHTPGTAFKIKCEMLLQELTTLLAHYVMKCFYQNAIC